MPPFIRWAAAASLGAAMLGPYVPATALATNDHEPARVRSSAHELAENKKLVVRFTNRLYNRHDLRAVGDTLTPDFVQHDPAVSDGRLGLRSYLTDQFAAHPDARIDVKRVIAEGDLVVVHSNLVWDPGTLGYAVLDLYRLRGDKVAEHWNTVQAVPDTTASGHDMFSTLSSPQTSQPDPHVDTAASKQLIQTYYPQVFVDRDPEVFDAFLADPYYQHNPGFPDGVEAAKAGVRAMFDALPEFHAEIVRYIAENDLVVLQSHATIAPGLEQAVFDIYRVRDGRAVEHWDIVQSIPTSSANDNGMF